MVDQRAFFDEIRRLYRSHPSRNQILAYNWESILSEPEAKVLPELIQYGFYPQYPVGKYMTDFGNPKTKEIIEIDGSHHYTQKGYYYDNKREFEMRANYDWRVEERIAAGLIYNTDAYTACLPVRRYYLISHAANHGLYCYKYCRFNGGRSITYDEVKRTHTCDPENSYFCNEEIIYAQHWRIVDEQEDLFIDPEMYS